MDFFFKQLDIRGFSFDVDLGQTQHFTEKIKKNTLKLLNILFRKENTQNSVISKLRSLVLDNIKQINSTIDLDENQYPVMSQFDKDKLNEISRKVIIYALKCFLEVLGKYQM
jgi:hypothetical protein